MSILHSPRCAAGSGWLLERSRKIRKSKISTLNLGDLRHGTDRDVTGNDACPRFLSS